MYSLILKRKRDYGDVAVSLYEYGNYKIKLISGTTNPSISIEPKNLDVKFSASLVKGDSGTIQTEAFSYDIEELMSGKVELDIQELKDCILAIAEELGSEWLIKKEF